MANHSKLAQDMERVVHKYLKNEEIKRSYGTDGLLSRAEIHTMEGLLDAEAKEEHP